MLCSSQLAFKVRGLPADEFLDSDVEHNREDTPIENDSEETGQEIRQQLLRALFL